MKEAIEVKDLILFMERTKLKSEGVYPKEIDEVIDLLKRGEQYKAMWKELSYEIDIMVEEGRYTPTSEFGMGGNGYNSTYRKNRAKILPERR